MTDKHLRALLIDPYNRTVTEIQHSGRLEDLYRTIGGPEWNPEACQTVCHADLGAGVDAWLDDNGNWTQAAWFRLGRNPVLYCGRMLLLGHDDEGRSADLPAVAEVALTQRLVEWLDDNGALAWATEIDERAQKYAKERAAADFPGFEFISLETGLAARIAEAVENKRGHMEARA